MEKEYIELFYLCTFTDDGQIYFVKTEEIQEPEMAEVAIPYHTEDKIYGVTCYITNRPNVWPCIMEMIALQTLFNEQGLPPL